MNQLVLRHSYSTDVSHDRNRSAKCAHNFHRISTSDEINGKLTLTEES